MPSGYAALCNDFYINQRLNLKMDLPLKRETVLAMFERVRRERPGMDRFKRYTNELALESRAREPANSYEWLGVRKNSVRSGSVNPESDAAAHGLHRLALQAAPFYLDVSALDVEYVEVLFGFDLLCSGNHDAIVFDTLMAGSPLAAVCEGARVGAGRAGVGGAALTPVECQPLVGVALSEERGLQAFFEVKTRSGSRGGVAGEGREEPISVYVIVRRLGPFDEIKDLGQIYNGLVVRVEELLDQRVLPHVLAPLRDAIG